MVRFKVKPKRGTYKPHHQHHREKIETNRGSEGNKSWRKERERKTQNWWLETVPPPCLPLLSSLLACFATTGDMRANEACSNAAKALHTCMAGSKGNVKASKSSVSLIHPRIFDPSFSFCGWILMIRSIIYLVRLVKGVKTTSNLRIYQKSIRRDLCLRTRGRRKTFQFRNWNIVV